MRGIKDLLLLAVFVHLARCQPKVSMTPTLGQIFSGDLFFLRCDNSAGESRVTWYFNDMEQTLTNDTWKIGVAAPEHSGSYQCESNGQKSDRFSISVLNYVPCASLTIRTGQPVVRRGGSVILQLDNEEGLQGWKCWVCRGGKTNKIQLSLTNDNASVVFQPRSLNVPEAIFWCTDSQQDRRSNQITVRMSEKDVSLEMYPLPAVVGESLTLKCLAWGTDTISRAVFYKNNAIIQESLSPTYKIMNVTESAKGRYKCHATFTYMARPAGPPYQVVSDNQEVFVQAPPIKALLSAGISMSCSCPLCPDNSSYRWYYKNGDPAWTLMDSSQGSMMPKASGTYACMAVWRTGRSVLSNGYVYQPPINSTLISVIIVLLILGSAVLLFYLWYSRRNTTGPIYEDVQLTSRNRGDDYERLQTGAKREAEYDTLHPEAQSRLRREGEYEAMKKEEMTGGEYHTLNMEGAAGGEGGYEALQKEGMKDGVYSTLGAEGAGGGEGAYEVGGKTDKD